MGNNNIDTWYIRVSLYFSLNISTCRNSINMLN